MFWEGPRQASQNTARTRSSAWGPIPHTSAGARVAGEILTRQASVRSELPPHYRQAFCLSDGHSSPLDGDAPSLLATTLNDWSGSARRSTTFRGAGSLGRPQPSRNDHRCSPAAQRWPAGDQRLRTRPMPEVAAAVVDALRRLPGIHRQALRPYYAWTCRQRGGCAAPVAAWHGTRPPVPGPCTPAQAPVREAEEVGSSHG